MLKLFEICLATGAIFTVVTFVLGHLLQLGGSDSGAGSDGVDFSGMEIDAGDISAAGMGGGTDFQDGIDSGSNGIFAFFKPTPIMAFITTFGGVGLISLKNGSGNVMALILAFAGGFGAAFLINRFVIMPLSRAQNTSAIPQQKVIGSLGTLSVGIFGEGFGRINYSVEGSIYNSPARSVDGKDIEKGSLVIIVEIKEKVFYVDKFEFQGDSI